jgi:hypothetical protein
VDDRARARPLPAQVSFQKNDLKRFESLVQMLVCLRGTFVRSGPPKKYFPTRKFICEFSGGSDQRARSAGNGRER